MFDLLRMSPQSISIWFLIVTQFCVFLKWAQRSYHNYELKKMNYELQKKFVSDMATNHLPHIYHALQNIARSNGIELDEPPEIKWVQLNGNGNGSNGHKH